MGIEAGIDIAAEERALILALLERYLPGTAAWAYGSRVKWTSSPKSDLDLVAFAGSAQSRQVGDLREALEESDLPFRVDLFVWDEVPESFRETILREHVELTRKNARPSDPASPAWKRVNLGEVTDLTLSSVDKKSKEDEKQVRLCNYMDVYNNPFIRHDMDFMAATATANEIKKCTLLPGDVVITKDSEKYDDIGVPTLIKDKIDGLVCGYHLAILRPKASKIDGAFLYYALTNDDAKQQFHSFANGITRFGLRKNDIGLVEIPFPSLPEQRAIARMLGTLDDKVELNRRMCRTLEEMARALFKSWFVDFEPVRAKMAGKDPGLPRHLADLFPDRLVDSELGKIPQGWEIKNLGDFADSPKRSINPADLPFNTPYIGLEHMREVRLR